MDNISKLIYQGKECDAEITIAIPTFNREVSLVKAVNSAIRQKTNIKYKVLISSNDSLFDLTSFLSKIDQNPNCELLIYKNVTNIGMGANLNRCFELATTEYVALLHDDDLLLPNYIDKITKAITHNRSFSCIVPARYVAFRKDDSIFGKKNNAFLKIKYCLSFALFVRFFWRHKITLVNEEKCLRSFSNCFYAPSCGTIFKRSVFLSFGLFNLSWKYSFDFISFLEFSKQHNIGLLHEYLGIYQMANSASQQENVEKEFKESFSYLLERNQDSKYVKSRKKLILFYLYPSKTNSKSFFMRLRIFAWKVDKTIYFYNHNLDGMKASKKYDT